MKQPSWEPSSGALAAFLQSTAQAVPIDLYTITLKSGTVLRYSGSDVAVTVNGNYYGLGPALKRTRTKQSVGISVDTMNIELYADSSVQVGGMGIIPHIALGYWDGGRLQLDHGFWDQQLNPKGVVPAFAGNIGQVQTQRGIAFIEVRSMAEMLDIMVPGDLYQPGCKNTLFDAYCGKVKSAYSFSGAVSSSVSASNNSFISNMGGGAGYYVTGVLTFNGGINSGVSRTIKAAWNVGPNIAFEFISPFPGAIQVGDAFTASFGCDKSMATCAGVFNNLANFRGEPFIPAPEMVT